MDHSISTEPRHRPAPMHVALSGPVADKPRQAASAVIPVQTAAQAAGLLDLPMPLYYAIGDLDRKPEALGEVALAYPADLPLVTRSRVVLSLLIDELGAVDKVSVESADSPKELEALASHAFAAAKFTPGVRGGVKVKSRLRIEVTFEGE